MSMEDADEEGLEEEERDHFPDEWDELEAEAAAWQEKFTAAMHSGDPMLGLPQGLRIRPSPAAESHSADAESPRGGFGGPNLTPQPLAARRWEFIALALVCCVSALCTLHFAWTRLLPAPQPDWRQGCQQCQPSWWQDFWHWRFQQLAAHGGDPRDAPPPGMQWEWGAQSDANDTDWYQASEEFVQDLVRPYADPSLGPVLQLGCGDAPVPEHLHRAGFPLSEHLDIVPEVIQRMRQKYPVEQWPGFTFLVRDFLSQGAPRPLGRFCAVLDKAGIWDWLQEEAPQMLPSLLALVRQALPPAPEEGVYIIATKLSPPALAETLAEAGGNLGFHVEKSLRLGDAGVAWGYVLSAV